VSRAVRRESEDAPAKVDFGVVLHQHRRCDCSAGAGLTQRVLEALAVKVRAQSQRAWQASVTHKLRLIVLERGRPKHVVGVDVRHHDVPDRQLSRLPNGGAQTLAVYKASAWVDDSYRVVANDEANVGYGVFVLWRYVFIHATSDVNSRCYFVGCERADFARDKRACGFVREKRTRVHRGLLCEGSAAAKARASE
jgi:hypothetical protein